MSFMLVICDEATVLHQFNLFVTNRTTRDDGAFNRETGCSTGTPVPVPVPSTTGTGADLVPHQYCTLLYCTVPRPQRKLPRPDRNPGPCVGYENISLLEPTNYAMTE